MRPETGAVDRAPQAFPLKRDGAFAQALLDSLVSALALVDEAGVIVAVNEAWRRFGREHGADPATIAGVGLNYLEICRRAARFSTETSDDTAAGIEQVLAGKQEEFTVEYPCNGPGQERWFLLSVRRLTAPGCAAMLSHVDITERRRAEDVAQALVLAGRELAGRRDFVKAAEQVVARLLSLFRIRQANLYRLDSETATLICVASAGANREQWLGRVIRRTEGVVGRAIARKQVVWTSDIFVEPGVMLPAWFAERAAKETLRASAGIPLMVGGEVIGALALADVGGRMFSASEIELMTGFADQAALALQNARSFEETSQQLRETETLLAVSRAIGTTLDPTETLRLVARETARIIGADMGGAYLADSEMRCLRPLAGYRVPKHLLETFQRFPVPLKGHPLLEESWASHRPAFSSRATDDPRLDRETMAHFPMRSILFVPMIVKGEPVGGLILSWWNDEHHFSASELRLIEGIGRQAGLAIEHSRLYREASQQASHMRSLAELGSLLAETLDLDQVAQRTADSIRRAVGARIAVLYHLEPDSENLVSLVASGDTDRVLGHPVVFASGTGAVALAVRSQAPFSSPNVLEDERVSYTPEMRTRVIQAPFRSVLAVPLRIHERVIGALAVCDRAGRTFSEEETRLTQSFADRAAVAMESARLYREIRDARDFLQSIAENSADAIVTTDEEGRVTYFSPGAEEIFGYTADTVKGRPVAEFYDGGREQARDVMSRLRRDGRIRNHELVFHRGDGRSVAVSASLSLLRDATGTIVGTVGILKDVTERRELEQQLRQSQKMDAIGQLAGGIAHDFNNLLTVITGRAQMMLARLRPDEPLHREVKLVRSTAERAATLTRQLLAFSRKQVLKPQVLDLNTIVEGMEPMLRRLLGEDIELAAVPDRALGRTKADPGQIEQVIVNLAVNARDAMPSGGKLTIETATVELDGAYAARHVSVPPGRYVMLAVSDTGIGMDEATRARVFEPFFTTKEPGKGTGLGLATVYGIVQQSGGSVHLYSEPGHGTTFKIYLPLVEEDLTEVEAPSQTEIAGGNETILLVEDEAEVRSLSRDILNTLGYRVLEASDPEEAMLIAERHPGPIELVLTDVVMPKMSGRALVERLAPARPETRALYTSGYTDEAIVHHGVLASGTLFIEKPFTPDGLARKVREALSRAPTIR
ncbi:MAG TPA: GAF domain-containing protein [Methylomirabilota bacterium]|nr:GAF domain-containing protein [Methylomirabilota bacterium]